MQVARKIEHQNFVFLRAKNTHTSIVIFIIEAATDT